MIKALGNEDHRQVLFEILEWSKLKPMKLKDNIKKLEK